MKKYEVEGFNSHVHISESPYKAIWAGSILGLLFGANKTVETRWQDDFFITEVLAENESEAIQKAKEETKRTDWRIKSVKLLQDADI